jgi:hypothetical protein
MVTDNCGGKGGKPGPCPTGGTEGAADFNDTLKGLGFGDPITHPNKNVSWSHKSGAWLESSFKKGDFILLHEGKRTRISKANLMKHLAKGRITGNTMTKEEKELAVTYLTVNCSCWQGKEEVLNDLDDETVEALAEEATANEANQSFVDLMRDTFEVPAEITTNAMPAFIAKGKGKKVPPAEEDNESEIEDTDSCGGKKMGKKPTMNEWLETMPDEARAVWNAAVEVERRERAAIIAKLVANYEGDKRKAKIEKLKTLPIDDLRDRLEDLTTVTNAAGKGNGDQFINVPELDAMIADYSLASAPAVLNTDSTTDDGPMPVQRFDWGASPVANGKTKHKNN